MPNAPRGQTALPMPVTNDWSGRNASSEEYLTVSGLSTISEPADKTPTDVTRVTSALRAQTTRVQSAKLNRRAAAALAATAEIETPAANAVASAAATRQSDQLPAFAPLLEELEVAGWSSHRRMLSGNFHDWTLLENRTLLVMAGQAVATPASEAADPMEAALVAQGAWAALRSHAQHAAEAGTLLSLAARSLWSNVNGELQMAVAIGLVDLDGGQMSVAVAGDCLAVRVRAAGCELVATRQPMLGAIADFSYLSHSVRLSLRERVVLLADDPHHRPAKLMQRVTASFARLNAETHRRMMAADAIAIVRQEFEPVAANDARPAASMVAVRRR
ncbi:MAG: SpoIIE family protein phosphatase [Pirellulales bacterium]